MPALSVEMVRAIDDEPVIGDLVAVANERNTMPDCAAAEAVTADRRTDVAALALPAGAERAAGAELVGTRIVGADIAVEGCPAGADHVCRATVAAPDEGTPAEPDEPDGPTGARLAVACTPDAGEGEDEDVDRVASLAVERRTT